MKAAIAILLAAAGLTFHGAKTDEKVVALTFDDGPHPTQTAEILDILEEYDVRATFFVIGKNAEANPELVKRELEEGHEVECHTYSHSYLQHLSYNEAKCEIERNESVLEGFGASPSLIRPPGGIISDSLKRVCEEKDYKIILWSVDTVDWKAPAPSRIIAEVKNNVAPGSVILMHDFVSGKSSTPAALRKIIPMLKDDGYKFVTVSELMSY